MPCRLLVSLAFSGVVAMATGALTTDLSAHAPRILVAALAHAHDEGPIAPVLARYAREGVQVYMIVVSDGNAGAGQQGHIPRRDVALTVEELASARAEEARCAAQALGVRPPILLGFPDGKLGVHRRQVAHLSSDATHRARVGASASGCRNHMGPRRRHRPSRSPHRE